jgi:hypothetical protein
MDTRTACVIANATPDEVASVGESPDITIRKNRLGTLVTGRPGDLVIDYAEKFPGPVYDVMYNARTGWFVVTIYTDLAQPVRWDNRPGTNPGYPRVDNVLGGETPLAILTALDIDAQLIGYAPA